MEARRLRPNNINISSFSRPLPSFASGLVCLSLCFSLAYFTASFSHSVFISCCPKASLSRSPRHIKNAADMSDNLSDADKVSAASYRAL